MIINGYVRPFNLNEETNTPVYDAPSERKIKHAQHGDYLRPEGNTLIDVVNGGLGVILVKPCAGEVSGADVKIEVEASISGIPGQTVAKDLYIYIKVSETDNNGEVLYKLTNVGANPTWIKDYETIYETPIARITSIDPGPVFDPTSGDELEILVGTDFGKVYDMSAKLGRHTLASGTFDEGDTISLSDSLNNYQFITVQKESGVLNVPDLKLFSVIDFTDGEIDIQGQCRLEPVNANARSLNVIRVKPTGVDNRIITKVIAYRIE